VGRSHADGLPGSSFIASSSIAAAVSRALLDVFNRWQCSSIRF
jgi:hypothetical protein